MESRERRADRLQRARDYIDTCILMNTGKFNIDIEDDIVTLKK